MAQSSLLYKKKVTMKRLIITLVLLVSLQGAFAQSLLDSLKGNWTVTQITTNTKNKTKAGTLYFSDDGKFVSSGNHFGSMHALYTTNETTSSVQIENINKSITEWSATIKNNTLYLTRVDNEKGKQPVIKITAVKKKE
jgi:hypothetical protein